MRGFKVGSRILPEAKQRRISENWKISLLRPVRYLINRTAEGETSEKDSRIVVNA